MVINEIKEVDIFIDTDSPIDEPGVGIIKAPSGGTYKLGDGRYVNGGSDISTPNSSYTVSKYKGTIWRLS